ncbi:hypothetical protein SAMN05216215_110214 [Saccharopolyspora shandongensis]|uniref:Uncharacterized protein n=1 Tax=Saccharopolyspora shandongensis TaxID=418495 RepID=A0A1H3U2K1_9PSEU|nr:hypothetical protein SAMN05216215_110214 [Saccharopolyspora shandongensis]
MKTPPAGEAFELSSAFSAPATAWRCSGHPALETVSHPTMRLPQDGAPADHLIRSARSRVRGVGCQAWSVKSAPSRGCRSTRHDDHSSSSTSPSTNACSCRQCPRGEAADKLSAYPGRDGRREAAQVLVHVVFRAEEEEQVEDEQLADRQQRHGRTQRPERQVPQSWLVAPGWNCPIMSPSATKSSLALRCSSSISVESVWSRPANTISSASSSLSSSVRSAGRASCQAPAGRSWREGLSRRPRPPVSPGRTGPCTTTAG